MIGFSFAQQLITNMDNSFSDSYWNKRWKTGDTGWDIGHASTPLINFIDTLTNKQLHILIPGAGNAWEAEYLFRKGFSNVYVLDIAREAIRAFMNRVPEFPQNQVITGDYFSHHAHYDLIVEQTFFCALTPALRANYVEHTHKLLAPRGELVGLLFDDVLNTDSPPFGGNEIVYRKLFRNHFNFLRLEKAQHSIKPRLGRELFIHFQVK